MRFKLRKILESDFEYPTIDLGQVEPISSNFSPINLINTWFNSADHASALKPISKRLIEQYLSQPNKITQLSQNYYKLQGYPILYRGLHLSHKHGNVEFSYQVGDTIEGSLDSWTSNKEVADRYARDGGVVLQLSNVPIDIVLLVDKVVHSNDYYLDKEEYLLKSSTFLVTNILESDSLSGDAPVLSVKVVE